MTTDFAISLWLTDAALLTLAYILGRIHGRYLATEGYKRNLGELIQEVKAIHRTVDRLGALDAARQVTLDGETNAPPATARAGQGIP